MVFSGAFSIVVGDACYLVFNSASRLRRRSTSMSFPTEKSGFDVFGDGLHILNGGLNTLDIEWADAL